MNRKNTTLGKKAPHSKGYGDMWVDVHAASLSARVVWTLTSPPISGRILSAHTRAVNILASDDSLLSLVHPSLGNGPFHATIDAPLPFSAWAQPGETVTLQEGRLYLGKVTIDLHRAAPWHPTVHWPHGNATVQTRDLVMALLNDVLPHPDDAHATAATARRIIAETLPQLVRAMRAGDEGAIRRELARIIGLGPGLTPAGDDAVLGVLAGSWAWGSPGLGIEEVAAVVNELAREGTHRLSREWLRAAGEGAFAEPWHHLARALAEGEPQAIRAALARILQTGATSGEYALLGFRAATATLD